MDEQQIIETLRGFLKSAYMAGDDEYPWRIVESFRTHIPQFEKYVCPVSEDLVLRVIRERYPRYPEFDVPQPTPTPTPVVEVQDLGPRVLSNNKQSAPKNETSPITSTGDEEMDNLVSELSKPEKKPRKQSYGKRQADQDLRHNLLLNFFNTDRARTRKAFKPSDIYTMVEWVSPIEERTMRRDLDELYRAGKLKMWKKPVILSGGQKVYHHMYTSATNPDPKFTLWIEK